MSATFLSSDSALLARFNISRTWSVVNGDKTNTLHLDSRALVILKLGFSVVAPILMSIENQSMQYSVMVPFSTYGRKMSC